MGTLWMMNMKGTLRDHHRFVRTALAVISVSMILCLSGCATALFPESEDRTQFDQYDRSRGQYVPEREWDIYGQSQPALRSRLSQKD